MLIWIVFQSANSNFLSPLNLTNLMLQIVAVGITSVGIILVLLLGEIDLSVGSVSGLTASIMAVANVKNGLPGPAAVLLAVLARGFVGSAPRLLDHEVARARLYCHAGRAAWLAGGAAAGAGQHRYDKPA